MTRPNCRTDPDNVWAVAVRAPASEIGNVDVPFAVDVASGQRDLRSRRLSGVCQHGGLADPRQGTPGAVSRAFVPDVQLGSRQEDGPAYSPRTARVRLVATRAAIIHPDREASHIHHANYGDPDSGSSRHVPRCPKSTMGTTVSIA